MPKMLPLLAALFLLTACGGGGEGENQAAPAGKSGGAGGPANASAPIGATEPLTGLYEAKSGGLSSQLCIVGRGQGEARFGLNLWGDNMQSCSGAGTLTREGAKVTLTMAGDRSCTVEARIEGNAIRLPDKVPEGCSYYCGARAKMTGVSLARTGTTEGDALKARDVVDEPLCEPSRSS